jgi:hypothetical protein
VIDGHKIVGNEEDGSPSLPQFADSVEAFGLERDIACGQDFVKQQNVRIEMRRNGEAQANLHAGRVAFDRHLDVLSHA